MEKAYIRVTSNMKTVELPKIIRRNLEVFYSDLYCYCTENGKSTLGKLLGEIHQKGNYTKTYQFGISDKNWLCLLWLFAAFDCGKFYEATGNKLIKSINPKMLRQYFVNIYKFEIQI